MRWNKPKDGDVKFKRRFALFPITVNKQTRWLELVTIKSVYYEDLWLTDRNHNIIHYWGWRDEEFVD